MAPLRQRAAKRRAHVFGLRAEWIALAWLTLRGYRILARRYSAAGGEIDIIARRGTTVAFVEVKARPILDEAAIAIDEIKTADALLQRAARAWPDRAQSMGDERDVARRCGVHCAGAPSAALACRLSLGH